MGVVPKKRTITRRARAEKHVYEEQKPEQIKGGNTNGKVVTEHDKQERAMFKVMRKYSKAGKDVNGNTVRKDIDAFKFMFNPKSFSQTVENVLHFRFL